MGGGGGVSPGLIPEADVQESPLLGEVSEGERARDLSHQEIVAVASLHTSIAMKTANDINSCAFG